MEFQNNHFHPNQVSQYIPGNLQIPNSLIHQVGSLSLHVLKKANTTTNSLCFYSNYLLAFSLYSSLVLGSQTFSYL